MSEGTLTETRIRSLLDDLNSCSQQCGFEAFVVTRNSPQLKRMSLTEKKNADGKSFRDILKEMFFTVIRDNFLSQDAIYADGRLLADNQHKILIFEQGESFKPFAFLNDDGQQGVFNEEDLSDAIGLAFRIRKDSSSMWLYQHLWSIMVPNKKRTSIMTRFLHIENGIEFSEMKDPLLAIAKKVDILIIDDCLVTSNISLLQKSFGFQDYIYQTATQTVRSIAQTGIVANTEKLTDYISRGKPKYAKKMMRIGSSKVLALSKEDLIDKITTVPRWQGKFDVDPQSGTITLNTYIQVESLIDLFDERYTRSDVTGTEYDTDVKSVAQPVE